MKAWLRVVVASMLICLFLLCEGRARAGDFDGTIGGWYGYQIVLSDLASLGAGLAMDNPYVLGGGYLVGPSLVHGLNGRKGMTVISPMLRLLLPTLGILIASTHKSCNSHGDECDMFGLFVGGGIGMGTAMLLDYSLAWRRAAPSGLSPGPGKPGEATQTAKPARVSLTSAGVAPTANGLSVVLGGSF